MRNIQYFIFDKTGNKVLEADILEISSDKELDEIKNNFETLDDFKNTGIILYENNKVVYNNKR